MLQRLYRNLARFNPAFGDLSALEKYRKSYRLQNLKDRAYLNQIGCLISIVIVTLGIPLDYVVYPDQFAQFTVLRLTEDAFLITMYWMTTWPSLRRYLYFITFCFTTSVILTVCVIILATDGAISPYYAGINLVMLGIGFMLGLSFREALFYTALSVASYLVVSAISGIPEGAVPIVINNSYFIFLTGVIAIIAAYFAGKQGFYSYVQEREIQRKNKELEEMDRLKSEFLANVSHELRTPLTVIVGPAKRLLHERSDSMPPEVVEVVQQVVRNGSRLIKLVNDVLELMTLESGQRRQNWESVNVQRLLENCTTQIRPLFQGPESRRELEVTLSDEPLYVMGDELQLERVFFNLLQNAYKFTDPGTGAVEVRMVPCEEQLIIQVTDNGVGIAPEHQQLIFERYRQADGSQTRRYQGTGIGLALVKEIVENHGGVVQVASAQGNGTTFTLSLPLAEAPEKPGTVEVPELYRTAEVEYLNTFSRLSQPVASPAAEVCLLIDDEKDMADFLQSLLAPYYRVQVAYDAVQARALCDTLTPQLVVTDQMLPGMSGVDFIKWLRAREATRETPVLMVTAKDDPATRQNALENGADLFLRKPFESSEFLQAIKTLRPKSVLYNAVESNTRSPLLVIVEDEPDLAETLTKALSETYQVDWIDTGEGALEHIRKADPDLVLLDHMLPGKDGLTLARELKSDPLLAGTPILLLTANARDSVKYEALELGVDDFLQKPFSWPELRARVTTLVKRSLMERALFEKNQSLEKTLSELKRSEVKLLQSERLRTLHLFSGVLIHEIGNPLNYALAASRVAAKHRHPETREAALADTQDGLNRIHGIVTELKDFLSPDDDHRALEPVVLQQAVARAAKLHRDQLTGIQLEVQGLEMVRVSATSTSLIHVFSNLIGNAANALNHAKVPSPTLWIKCEENSESNAPNVQVVVTDNGPGVDPAIRPTLFEPFCQTLNSHGLGLGLPICRTLLSRIGGAISFDTEYTGGARFVVTLVRS